MAEEPQEQELVRRELRELQGRLELLLVGRPDLQVGEPMSLRELVALLRKAQP